jgi:hypothetical protein
MHVDSSRGAQVEKHCTNRCSLCVPIITDMATDKLLTVRLLDMQQR